MHVTSPFTAPELPLVNIQQPTNQQPTNQHAAEEGRSLLLLFLLLKLLLLLSMHYIMQNIYIP
jgi:hypothetical protein